MMMRTLAILSFATTVLSGCAIANRMSGMSLVHEMQERGICAEATILEIQDTRIRVNDDPVVKFYLEVQPSDGEPYHATTKSPIPVIHIPQFQPGAEVPVRFDPEDPSRVALDIYSSEHELCGVD